MDWTSQGLRIGTWLVGFWFFDLLGGMRVKTESPGRNLAFILFAVGLAGAALSSDAVASFVSRRFSGATGVVAKTKLWVTYAATFIGWFAVLCVPTTITSALVRSASVGGAVGESVVNLLFGVIFALVIIVLRKGKSSGSDAAVSGGSTPQAR